MPSNAARLICLTGIQSRTVYRQLCCSSQAPIPLAYFYSPQMLTKNPEDYPDAKSQPHVQVALRFNQQAASSAGGGHRFRAGDTVEYIVCDDGTSRSAVQRAYSPAELSAGIKPTDISDQQQSVDQQQPLKVDVHYYLASQIHPVVSRLVAPIEGTSSAHVADCLGLDSSSYRRSMAASSTATASAGDALQEVSYSQLSNFPFLLSLLLPSYHFPGE